MENVFVSDVIDYVRLQDKMRSTDKKVREHAINTLKNELIPSIKEKGDVYEKYFYIRKHIQEYNILQILNNNLHLHKSHICKNNKVKS